MAYTPSVHGRPLRPILRWAGSKRKLIQTLAANAPPVFERYIEPFCGSACLFFQLRPANAILSDRNTTLMDTYRTLRRHPWVLARRVAAFGGPENYYSVRDTSTDHLGAVERAARFVFLNRFCFNGVYRTNRSGSFNVPRGINTGKVPSELEFYRAASALRAADLRHGDFETSLEGVRKGDFVYLDPPYGSSTRECYGEYGYDCFGPSDLDRLAACLRRIDAAGAKFLLSFRLSSDLLQRVKPFQVQHLEVRRHVAGFARSRFLAQEVLVRNYDCD